ncbi:MAG: adenylate/guanylate cyclase domain-containing protein [Betaproteobacteria bacterium]|nr:adenylate/guanylate cyclase domain-containing protein [Betaproteobacteria bacterium]
MDTPTEAAVLFADVSGSTKLYDTVGDKVAFAAVQQCVDAFTECTVKHNGRVIKTIGDEVMAVFPDAAAATLAAIAMQNELDTLEPTSGTRLGARIGYQYGPVIERDNDLFGDCVNLAARLSGVAIRGQVITTRATADRLNVHLRAACRQLHAIDVKGKGEVEICEVLWKEGDQTVTVTAPSTSSAIRQTTLVLKYGGREIVLDAGKSALAFGRDKAAEWVIDDPNASRQHGAFEYRGGKFHLTDHSANGTWVTFDGNAEFVLRRESCTLLGRGWIAFGQSRDKAGAVMEFTCR